MVFNQSHHTEKERDELCLSWLCSGESRVIHKALIIHREVHSLFQRYLNPAVLSQGTVLLRCFIMHRSVWLAACDPMLRL